MGFGGISIPSLLLILLIVVLLFGTKKLRNMGGDLGSAIKSFRSAVRDGDSGGDSRGRESDAAEQETPSPSGSLQDERREDVAEGEVIEGQGEVPRASERDTPESRPHS